MSSKSNLEGLVKQYITQAGAKSKQTLEAILQLRNAERHIYGMLFESNQRACLRVLIDACKKRRSRDVIKPFVIRDVDKLLSIEDDKARKNASILIGLCAPDECADKLSDALENEKTRFVRPSIILALGNTKDPGKYLDGYIIEPGEDKHIRQEGDALKKALAKMQKPKKALNIKLPLWSCLTSLNKSALLAELVNNKCEFKDETKIENAFNVRTKDIKDLRCYIDALYYIGDIGGYAKAADKLIEFGLKGLSYRIEAGEVRTEERREVIRAVSKGFSEFGFFDNPSAYSFEIRLTGGSMYVYFLNDERFSYREKSIPASINPVAAASIMRICKPYMKQDAVVLDPFCGSATMLIEREYIQKTKKLVGVDIAPAAIKAACANRKASGMKISLIKADILSYEAEKYDEVISNMPFGIRVSGHDANVKLYKAFSDKLPSLMKKDGVAFLYTQEKKLLRDVIKQNREFTIVREEKFESGGLCPTLFIIKRG